MSGNRKKSSGGKRQGQQFLRGPRPRRLSLKRRRRRQMITGGTVTLLVLLSLTTGWLAGTRMLHFLRSSPAFTVSQLEIEETPRVDQAELTVLHRTVDARANIFSIRLADLARKVEKHRWVESCSIKRELPHRLSVRLVEKTPAGLVNHGGRLLLVDSLGEVIEEPPASGAWQDRFPLLTGFGADTAWPAHQERVRQSLPLVALLLVMEQERTIPRVARIDMSEARNTRIWFEGHDYPLLMGSREYTERLNRYRLMEKTIEERHGDNLQYVDLRFRDRVIVRPDPGMGEEGRS